MKLVIMYPVFLLLLFKKQYLSWFFFISNSTYTWECLYDDDGTNGQFMFTIFLFVCLFVDVKEFFVFFVKQTFVVYDYSNFFLSWIRKKTKSMLMCMCVLTINRQMFDEDNKKKTKLGYTLPTWSLFCPSTKFNLFV